MKPGRRLHLLLMILALLAALVFLDDRSTDEPDGLVKANIRASTPAYQVSERDEVDSSRLILALRDRKALPSATVHGFDTRDWTPVPPPSEPSETEPLPPEPSPPPEDISSPPPSPVPQAPPLPFTFVGKQWQSGKWTIFLVNLEQIYLAEEGMTIESDYRVESIAPPILTLRYLPLKQRQTLDIGSAE